MIEMESNLILLLFALVIFSVNTILQKNSRFFFNYHLIVYFVYDLWRISN